MNNKNDCSAGLVKLDLNQLIKVCGYAITESKNEMNRQQRSIDNHLSETFRLDESDHRHFKHLCNAHSETDYFIRAAKQYAESVDQYFYLMEAKKREEIKIIK